MIFLAFLFVSTGFCALCLGSRAFAAGASQSRNRSRIFHTIGWLLLLLSVFASINVYGAAIGIAVWFGLASLAAALTMLVRAYAPGLLLKTGLLVGVCALCQAVLLRFL